MGEQGGEDIVLVVSIRTYLKITLHRWFAPVIIPDEAGNHAYQGVKWTPAFARVTDSSR